MKKLTRILSLIIFISTTTRPAQEWTHGLNIALSAALGLLTYSYFGTGNSGAKPKASYPEIRLDFRHACKVREPYSNVVNRHTSNNSSPSSHNLSLVLAFIVCCGTYAFLESKTKDA